jgi:signal transduction histidine kinase
VDTARLLTGARYAALGVARPNGQGLREFITVGLDSASEAAIGARPRGVGILGLLLTLEKPLRIDKLSAHPASVGFPPNHPPMTSFLGVPIRSGETVIGSLYLTDKIGASTFTEADEAAVVQIGSYAAVAIHNLILLSRQKSLVSGLIFAQEEERRAIAYDLHDGLTQYVMAAHAHIDSFRRLYREKHLDKAERELEHGMRYLKDAVVESRRLVNGVRSLALDDLGLAGAIEQLVVEEKERAEWETASFVHNLADRRFDRTVETAVYRIVQEALTNARKHSHAKNVRVMLVEHHDDETDQITLEVEVRDWGIGFEPNDAAAGEGHVGLQGMVERVHLLGGSLRFESKLGEGSAIMVQVPVIDVHTDTKQGSTNE